MNWIRSPVEGTDQRGDREGQEGTEDKALTHSRAGSSIKLSSPLGKTGTCLAMCEGRDATKCFKNANSPDFCIKR